MADATKSFEKLVNRFVTLANNMKNEGHKPQFISDAMMMACGSYITYMVAGNQGGLNESGIEKMTKVFEDRLRLVQDLKKAALQEVTEGQGKSAGAKPAAND